MTLTFVTGERPSQPLVVTVSNVSDISIYDTVTLEADSASPDLPTGTLVTAPPNQVQIVFSAPFTDEGVYRMRVKLERNDNVDYSTWFEFQVSGDLPELLLSTGDVFVITTSDVGNSDIAHAQALISLAVGVDLSDEDWFSSLRVSDQRLLKIATAWEAVNIRESGQSTGVGSSGSEQIDAFRAAGIRSYSQGELSVSFDSSSTSNSVVLSDRAQLALSRLSWFGKDKYDTIFVRSGFDRYCPPDYKDTLGLEFGYGRPVYPLPDDWAIKVYRQ